MDINDEMTQTALDFIQTPKNYLFDLVTNGHYDSCHRTKEYDADQCHKDCEEQEKSEFANSCRLGGGLFKCCIR